ncbi:Sulfotransferase domain protein [Roseovarius litorisediminis]|uniref:Sulfotransferase domain protein n=1 Tax=Roseovarius litorisediminis TaxID=1312363 RepID=A0A1Y5TNX8_9RHOB|nr:sulfotransferase domain-containing protein [Roseovarius litorisediminis]SLN68114.1 Sulfotransferase domain protein [Roseovarius litorisediminis]
MGHPNNFFILAGAPKCGTTAIANWMKDWPGFHLHSKGKEPRFFTDFHDTSWTGPGADRFLQSAISNETEYLEGFAGEAGDWAIDASTDYLWCDASPELIKSWAQRFHVKIACILRDPVDRVISEYQHTLRDHLQSDGLRRSIDLENSRYQDHWQPLFYHLRRSRYFAKIEKYRQVFGDDFMVLGYHELQDPKALSENIARFLGCSILPTTPISRKNASHSYRMSGVAKFMRDPEARRMARFFVPKPFRAQMRNAVASVNQKQFIASLEDRAYIYQALEKDILACRAAEHIPTDGWHFQ